MDVAKVDRYVAYVAMVVHVVASVFIFHTYVHVFNMGVAYVCKGFQVF
jgi:hypothetical protein